MGHVSSSGGVRYNILAALCCLVLIFPIFDKVEAETTMGHLLLKKDSRKE